MLDLSVLAKYVTAFGVIAAATISAENRYAPASAMGELKAELRVDRIFDLANQARADGSPRWICDALGREIVILCTENPDHYLCREDAQQDIKSKSGC